MKVLITGDSHLHAIADGLALARRQGDSLGGCHFDIRHFAGSDKFRQPFFRSKGEMILFRPESFYLDKLYRRLPSIPLPEPAQPDILAFSGPLDVGDVALMNSNFHKGRIRHSPQVLRQTLADRSRYWLDLVDALIRNGRRVAILPPPGLFRSSPLVRCLLETVTAETLIEFYRFLLDSASAQLPRSALAVGDLPDALFDDDGFMLERFRNANPEDPHHANAVFGHRLLQIFAASIGAGDPAGPAGGDFRDTAPSAAEDFPKGAAGLAAMRGEPSELLLTCDDPAAFSCPPWLRLDPASCLDRRGLRLCHQRGGAARRQGEDTGLGIPVPGTLAARLQGRRVRVRIFLRCAPGGVETRLAAAYSVNGATASGWRWLEARDTPASDYFEFEVPDSASPSHHLISLRPDGGEYWVPPAPEIYLITVKLV